MKEYLERAEYLKGVLKKASEPPPPVKAPGGGPSGGDANNEYVGIEYLETTNSKTHSQVPL